MEEAWAASAVIVDESIGSCSALFAHLTQPSRDSSEAVEPPRKRQRITKAKAATRKDVQDSDGLLLRKGHIVLQFPDAFEASGCAGRVLGMNIAAISQGSKNNFHIILTGLQSTQSKTQIKLKLGQHSSATQSFLSDFSTILISQPRKSGMIWIKGTICVASGSSDVLLQLKVYLRSDRSWQDLKCAPAIDALVRTYLTPLDVDRAVQWSPQDFYENVHVPSHDQQTSPCLDSLELDCKLYPFQKRAVQWMMGREGNTLMDDKSRTEPEPQNSHMPLPPSFRTVTDADGIQWYISDTHQLATRNETTLLQFRTGADFRGGILAEEMGLGKTVELISLVTLNKLPEPALQAAGDDLLPTAATLIITPAHIMKQWIDEIATHAPHLRVYQYHGMGNTIKKDDTLAHLVEHDIVLTTYSILSKEIHFARDPPERNLRHAPRYHRPKCPLTMIKWWRVCLDEAQMIESGVSQAAEVARLIPRVNAWAVSGTPLRKNVEDLHGLLIFLGYQPFASSKKSWKRIDKATLKQIVGEIAIRHNKHKVAHELKLPPQRRVVMTMPFTAIEEQNYDQVFQRMCGAVGLNLDGSPSVEDWNPERYVESMRTWLRRLRETCLHPNVGSHNRRVLGRGKGPLRTVHEVLETMIEQNHTDMRTIERSKIFATLTVGHVINNDKTNVSRSEHALAVYIKALEQAEPVVRECREECAAEEKVIKERRFARRLARRSNKDHTNPQDDSDGEDEERNDMTRLVILKRQLRSALEGMHACVFYVASAYFQMKAAAKASNDHEDDDESRRLEELETQYYDRAKALRFEMLAPARDDALRSMAQVSSLDREKFAIQPVPIIGSHGGIESRRLLEQLDTICNALDAQALLINEWRSKIVQILTKQLVDTENNEELTGEEYEDSTKTQDELYVYMLCLRVLTADRFQLASGTSNALTESDLRFHVKIAKDGKPLNPDDKGHAPDLLLRLAKERQATRPKFAAAEASSLQAIIFELRMLELGFSQDGRDRARLEAEILQGHMHTAREIASKQRDVVKELEKQHQTLHACMNHRVEYYKQLQEISDMVAPWREELDDQLDERVLAAEKLNEAAISGELETLRTKRRFLLHLREDASNSTEGRTCVICTDTFTNGVLTICGHSYCKDCISYWRRSHRTCPECRRNLSDRDMHQVTYRPQQLKAKEEVAGQSTSEASSPSRDSGSSNGSSMTSSIYSSMSSETMDKINSVVIDGSFGTKIDTICRHLIWLREHDPGAKSIIFSQYSDFLGVLSSALTHCKINAVSIRTSSGIERFRRDPAVECFLLDAKSDSSGLNLVNATHVFLCEPMVNAAIELQAIARVHRIGQMRETTVYMYLISDTVEEAIYEISVNRRLAHMSKPNANSSGFSSTSLVVSRSHTPALDSKLDEANILEMQQKPVNALLAKGKNEGELVDSTDLWNCLFGRARGAAPPEHTAVAGALRTEVDRQLRVEAVERRQRMEAEEDV